MTCIRKETRGLRKSYLTKDDGLYVFRASSFVQIGYAVTGSLCAARLRST